MCGCGCGFLVESCSGVTGAAGRSHDGGHRLQQKLSSMTAIEYRLDCTEHGTDFFRSYLR